MFTYFFCQTYLKQTLGQYVVLKFISDSSRFVIQYKCRLKAVRCSDTEYILGIKISKKKKISLSTKIFLKCKTFAKSHYYFWNPNSVTANWQFYDNYYERTVSPLCKGGAEHWKAVKTYLYSKQKERARANSEVKVLIASISSLVLCLYSGRNSNNQYFRF